ncbi:hypothetical protein N9D24_00020 [bacterium]|nr:hypothetical protein [bacterium]
MTYEQRKQERQALIDHLLAQAWNVFGTLKFVNGRTIGRNSANKLLRNYWNKIDRLMFGKAAERQNMRVPRWCFAHEGGDTENYHIHFALQAPILDVDHMGAVRLIRTRIRLLAQPESMRTIVGATQQEQRFD